MDWIQDLPVWGICTLMVVACIIPITLGTLAAWRFSWRISPEDDSNAAVIHAFIGVVYAVALALIVVFIEQGYQDVQNAVVEEVSAAEDLYHNCDGLDESTRVELQRLIWDYIELVSREEWPAEQDDRRSRKTWMAVNELSHELVTFSPADDHESQLYSEMLAELDRLLDARRDRLFLGQQGISAITWTIIVVGAIITLGFCCFLSVKSLRAHLIMNAAMAALFGLILALVVSMDRPLRGEFSIPPDAFEQLEMRLSPRG